MGSNGLNAVETLATRQKCPDSPTKKKFRTSADAWAEAETRSKETGITIIAYACAGCGYFHLSRKKDGSDVARVKDGVVETAAMRGEGLLTPIAKLAPVGFVAPERSDDPRVYPPGNMDARLRVLSEYVADHPGPLSVLEVRAMLSCSVDTARDTLKAAGFTSKRGPGAKWEPPTEAPLVVEDATVDWETVTSVPNSITMVDYIQAMAGVGLSVRIQVRPKGTA